MSADPSEPVVPPGSLPLNAWKGELAKLCEEIQRIGLEIVSTHRGAGDDADRTSRWWKLAERQRSEHGALETVLGCVSQVGKDLEMAAHEPSPESRQVATQSITKYLPDLERAFLVARQAALDLLLWTRREGHLAGSDLPERYRACYAELISWSPVFKPWLEGFEERLVQSGKSEDTSIVDLLSALSRFNAALDSARRFVKAVADPPLELVFHETNLFLQDWEQLPGESRAALASSLNDTCALLLYDRAEFGRRVEEPGHALAADLEASIRLLPVEGWLVLFSVDEDPLFRELTITLYRVVAATERDQATAQILQHLHHKLGYKLS